MGRDQRRAQRLGNSPGHGLRQQAQITSTIFGARTLAQLDANLASLDVTIPADHLAELNTITEPTLNLPADFITDVGFPAQQGGTTINEHAPAAIAQ